MGLLLFGVLALLAFLLPRVLRIGRRGDAFPPGPPTLPILGNILSISPKFTHLQFSEWGRKYGPVFSLKLGPQTVIVLGGAPAVSELIDKRSTSTVDRPPLPVVDAITGGYSFALARYGSLWRVLRKAASAILVPQAALKHRPIQMAESTQFLHDLIHTPKDFYKGIRRLTNSTILSILFGIRSPRYETPHTLELFEQTVLFNEVLNPSTQPPLDLLPILKYVPERWARWKQLVREVRTRQRKLYFGLVEATEERMKQGVENGCYMEGIINNKESLGLSGEMIPYLGAVFMEAGSDTSSILLQTVPLMLSAFPEAQKKAQEEVDRVIGDRLPTFEDFDNLPYIKAIVLELLRLRPPFPLGVPHANLQDEEYAGFFIPKGSTIFINIWGIYHDPDMFDDPEKFWPDRFLLTEFGTKPGVDDTGFRSTFTFGGGRRICPGIHLANTTLLLNITNMIWGFNFSPGVDEHGQIIPPDVNKMFSGISYGPSPYDCEITPRNEVRKELMEAAYAGSTETFMRFEHDLDPEEKLILKKKRQAEGARASL